MRSGNLEPVTSADLLVWETLWRMGMALPRLDDVQRQRWLRLCDPDGPDAVPRRPDHHVVVNQSVAGALVPS